MRTTYKQALTIAVLGTTLGMTSCVFRDGDLVINEKVCVNLDEFQTTGTFSTFAVADKFKDVLERKLAQHNKGKKDVKSIHMVSATFKTTQVKPHDWNVDAEIQIARQDDPNGAYDDGPAPLVVFEDQSLKELRGRPTDADLLVEGVDLVDRALESLLVDEDPRLILLVENETVTPTPSEADPMRFKCLVCVKFQFVIDLGHDDDDDDDDDKDN
jgi:hypothetical protein